MEDAVCNKLLNELYYSKYCKVCLHWKYKELERFSIHHNYVLDTEYFIASIHDSDHKP
jgi:hypothetical protein